MLAHKPIRESVAPAPIKKRKLNDGSCALQGHEVMFGHLKPTTTKESKILAVEPIKFNNETSSRNEREIIEDQKTVKRSDILKIDLDIDQKRRHNISSSLLTLKKRASFYDINN